MAIEGVRRLGREYDRRLLRSRNDAIENATCGMGNIGTGLPAAALTKVPSIVPVVEKASTGGCGSKSGGCGSRKSTEIVVAPTPGGCCSSSSPSKELDTPAAELGGFNTHSMLAGGGGGGGFSQMHCRPPIPSLPTWTQQLVRSFIYGSQFSAAFLV